MVRETRLDRAGFTRLVMELADLPGHPARAIAHRHKAAMEAWWESLLAKAGVSSPAERAREVVLLHRGRDRADPHSWRSELCRGGGPGRKETRRSTRSPAEEALIMTKSAEPYRLSLALAATGGDCLWAENDRAKARFGYAVATDSLPLTDALKNRVAAVVRRYEAATAGDLGDPDMPFGPYLFGFEPEAAGFAAEVRSIAIRLQEELGPEFAIEHSFDEPPPPIVGWRWSKAAGWLRALIRLPKSWR